MIPFPPEVTVSFTRILIPWGVKAMAKGEFSIPSNLTNAAVAKIMDTIIPAAVFSDGVISDIGGHQSPPHTICSIEGEVTHEDGAIDPFSWEARAQFNAFKGLTHIESKIEHRQSDMFPSTLSPQELALSLPIKINECIVMITYYEPKHSRFFGPSASAVGTLTISISKNVVAFEATYKAETKDKAVEMLSNKSQKLLSELKNLKSDTSQLVQ